jgi:hypothetical protein
MAAAKAAKAARTPHTQHEQMHSREPGLHVAEWFEPTATTPATWKPVPAPQDIDQWFIAAQTTALLAGHTVAVLQKRHSADHAATDPADCAYMPKPFCYTLFQGGTAARRVVTLWPTNKQAAFLDMTAAMWQRVTDAAAGLDTAACVQAVCSDAMWAQTLSCNGANQAPAGNGGAGTAGSGVQVAVPAAVPVVSLEATLDSFTAHGVIPPPTKLLAQLSGAAVHDLPLVATGPAAAPRATRGSQQQPPRHRSTLLKEAHANSGVAAICVAVLEGDGDDDSDGSHSDGSRDDEGDGNGDDDGDGDDNEDAEDGVCGARNGAAGMLAALSTICEDRDDDDGDGDGDLDGVAAAMDEDDDDEGEVDDDSDGALFGFDNDHDDEGDE